ncbi:MAG: methionine--tRNA ligase, partial [Rhizobiaceae bacterium]|nr:methionine--tRNA ligase [Rhizobiaceae bacterium]
FFLREIPFGNDGNYSDEAIINRIHADLANDFGNLAQRSLSMINKNCEGRVPAPGKISDADKALLDQAYAVLPASREFIDKQLIHKYLDQLWQVVGEANRYFASQEPWALKKTDPERMNTVLFVTAEIIRVVAILAQPVMPESSGKFLDLLAVDESARSFDQLNGDHTLAAGTELPKPEGIFPRYVEKTED